MFITVINLMVVQLSREEPMIEILITDYLILAVQRSERCETLCHTYDTPLCEDFSIYCVYSKR
jgi:hypothetical protein